MYQLLHFFKAILKYKSICEIADPNDVNTQINEQILFYFYHSLIESANVAIKNPDLNLNLNAVVDAVSLPLVKVVRSPRIGSGRRAENIDDNAKEDTNEENVAYLDA